MGKKKTARSINRSSRARSPKETSQLIGELATIMVRHGEVLREISDDLSGADMDVVTVYTGNAFSGLETVREWMETQLVNKIRPSDTTARLEIQGRLLQRLQQLFADCDCLEEKCGGRQKFGA